MRILTILAVALAVQTPAGSDKADTSALTPGTVSVELAGDHPGADGVFADAVGKALLNANFLVLQAPGHSRYVAEVTVAQQARGVVEAGAGGSSAASRQGAGLQLALPSGRTGLHGLVVTRLTVRLLLRGDKRAAWSGSAVTAQVADTPAGDPATVARKLADAVVGRFPKPSDGPIAIP